MSEEINEIKKPKKPVLVRFIGGGRFLAGIPARDLTIREWERIPRKKQKHLTDVLRIYEVIYD